MAIGLGTGLALGASLLGGIFGGGDDGGDFSTNVITPDIPSTPLRDQLSNSALQTSLASSPWLSSPFRAIDYFANQGTPGNYAPQFTPGSLPSYPVGGMGYMGDFTQNPLIAAALDNLAAQMQNQQATSQAFNPSQVAPQGQASGGGQPTQMPQTPQGQAPQTAQGGSEQVSRYKAPPMPFGGGQPNPANFGIGPGNPLAAMFQQTYQGGQPQATGAGSPVPTPATPAAAANNPFQNA